MTRTEPSPKPSERQPDLSIIIVNWNSKAFMRQCLISLDAHCRDLAFEVVVVDSGSFDGCGEMLRQEFPQVHFIQSENNVGFARANNLGFQSTRGRNLLFLNPDTEVTSGSIQQLLEQLEALPEAGAVGCRILNPKQSVQTSCIQSYPTILNQLLNSEVLRRWTPRSPLWGMAALYSAAGTPEPVQAISGACLMLKRNVFEQVGRFSEDYFMYAEDIDLCYQLRRAGWRNYYVPGASIIHHGGGSSQQSDSSFSTVMMQESVYRFLRKVRGKWYSAGFRLLLGLSAIGRLLVLVMTLPFRVVRGRMAKARVSLRKWTAILRWSLGLESWVGNYR